MPRTMRSIFSGIARPVSGVNERAVPESVTVDGMTLNAVPPWMLPTVTTAESSGEISRETTDCSDSTIRAAARMGSAASCGIAPCPPRPSISIEKLSTAAISAPRLIPTRPTGIGLRGWRPSVPATPSSAPSATQDSAPPCPSSAGWYRNRNPRSGGRPTSRSATASAIAMWPSWPQACIRPGSGRSRARRSPPRAAGRPCPRAASGARRTDRRRRGRRSSRRRCAGDRESSASRAATTPAVRRSSKASSGCA